MKNLVSGYVCQQWHESHEHRVQANHPSGYEQEQMTSTIWPLELPRSQRPAWFFNGSGFDLYPPQAAWAMRLSLFWKFSRYRIVQRIPMRWVLLCFLRVMDFLFARVEVISEKVVGKIMGCRVRINLGKGSMSQRAEARTWTPTTRWVTPSLSSPWKVNRCPPSDLQSAFGKPVSRAGEQSFKAIYCLPKLIDLLVVRRQDVQAKSLSVLIVPASARCASTPMNSTVPQAPW